MGLHIGLTPGVIWNIGPYTLRAMAHRQRSEDRGGTRGHKKGDSWLIGLISVHVEPQGFPDRFCEYGGIDSFGRSL